jgi:hypothetical protein
MGMTASSASHVDDIHQHDGNRRYPAFLSTGVVKVQPVVGDSMHGLRSEQAAANALLSTRNACKQLSQSNLHAAGDEEKTLTGATPGCAYLDRSAQCRQGMNAKLLKTDKA